MFAQTIHAAIEAADVAQLDRLLPQVWSAWSAGAVSDADAQHLAELVQARKAATRTTAGAFRAVGVSYNPRKLQPCPRTPERLARRRRIIAPRALPPVIADRCTPAEAAVLTVISNIVRQRGLCDRTVDEIAARAACSRRTVQRALRLAERLGWITLRARPRRGLKSLTNIIRVLAPAWRSWLNLGSPSNRVTELAPHDQKVANHLVRNSEKRPRLPFSPPIAEPCMPITGDFRWAGCG